MDRVEPQAGHAEPGQIVQPADQSTQVALAVAVGILEAVDLEAVDDRRLVPTPGHPHTTHSPVRSALFPTPHPRPGCTRLLSMSIAEGVVAPTSGNATPRPSHTRIGHTALPRFHRHRWAPTKRPLRTHVLATTTTHPGCATNGKIAKRPPGIHGPATRAIDGPGIPHVIPTRSVPQFSAVSKP